MIQVLQDGFSSFQNHFWVVFYILLIVIWGQFVMRKLLSKIFANSFTDVEYFSLSLAGWIFPLAGWAILYFLINLLFGKTLGIIVSIILFLIPLFWVRFKKPSFTLIILILFLLTSVLLRLAWLEKALLPSYFDSAEHYKNIQNLLSVYNGNSFSSLLPYYYHLGYHFISAALIHFFDWNIANFMLVFGQVILATLPISFFFLVKQITSSNCVALFSCLMAGFGFHMPAHLINWGKYPALLSLVGIHFFLCIAYLALHDQKQNKRLYFLIVISVIITALIHTRSLIVFFIFAISYFIILLQKNFSIQTQHATFFAVFIIFIAELFFIQRNNVLAPLVNGYFMNDVWILLFILLLIPFAIRSHLHLTFLLFIALSIFIAVLFIPSQIPNYGIMTLLDRPYVQMLAYIPLTVLAGLGFSEILQIVQKNSNARTPRPALSQWERGKLSKLKDFLIGVRVYIKSNQQLRLTYITTAIIFGIVIFKANFNYKFYPSECCQLVNRDDLSAIAWIEKNIPTDENILIAVSQLHVTAYEAPSPAAVDAGIWITPLTGRITSVAFIDTNFKKNEIHTFYCMQNVGYIYVGSMPDSFKQTQLNNQPTWYQPVFLLPTTQVYEVIGCK